MKAIDPEIAVFEAILRVRNQRWLWNGIFWGSGIEIFHFGLDQKIPGNLRSGDRDRGFEMPKDPQ